MSGAAVFSTTDQRMRQIFDPQHAFVGCGTLWMGDFSQLPPIKDTSLAAALVHSVAGVPKGAKNVAVQEAAVSLMRGVRKKAELTIQKRSNGYKRVAELTLLLRRSRHIGDDIICFLEARVLTVAAIKKDPSWTNSGHYERRKECCQLGGVAALRSHAWGSHLALATTSSRQRQ